MKQEYKEQWLKALRSGKYEQGQTALKNKDDNTYCCLGVLSEVCFGKIRQRRNGEEYLNISARREVGLTENQQIELARMNDGGWNDDNQYTTPRSFREIADYIEQNL